jgi:Holliday junction resolvase RusA-like endonuclease
MTSFLLSFPLEPVPASRPRVTRWGAYYGKRYTSFRKQAELVIPEVFTDQPLVGTLEVLVTFFCKRPKTTKREEPRGDVDNYVKAILDSCNGKVFEDDDQIKRITATKRWEDEDGARIELYVSQA